MNILVTGGAGFIGRRLCAVLSDRGHSVTALDNLSPTIHGYDPRTDVKADRLVVCDVRDATNLARHLGAPEVVVHLAAKTGVGESMYEATEYASVNCVGTSAVLDVVLRPGSVSRVILASSRAVYGEGAYKCSSGHQFVPGPRTPAALRSGLWDIACPICGRASEPLRTRETTAAAPGSIYGATKLSQEAAVRILCGAREVEPIALRFFNVYGPGQSLHNPYTGILGVFARRARAGQSCEVFEDGAMLRDFVHVDDVVRALVAAVELRTTGGADAPASPEIVANVGTGVGVTILEIAQRVAEFFGAPEPVITGAFRIGDIRHCVADPEAAARSLGFRSRIAFPDGVKEYAEWFCNQPANDVGDGMAELLSHQMGGKAGTLR